MTAITDTIRTTAFRLHDDVFGRVYAYHCGDTFAAAWEKLELRWRKKRGRSDHAQLPYRSLGLALRVLTGDFVAIHRKIGPDRYLIISRKRITARQLQRVLRAWETITFDEPGALTDAITDITERPIDVATLITRRSGACPTIDGQWPWQAAVCEIAHRLAGEKLRADDRKIPLRIDSDASLVTWTDLIENKERYAMHRIVPRLITVPGIEDPVVSLYSSLVRLDPKWVGARWGWADLGEDAPLLHAAVRVRKKDPDAGWMVEWNDGAVDLLKRLRLDPLPTLDPLPPPNGAARTGFRTQPRWSPIGSGVGQLFHECVAHHARNTLCGLVEPLDLVSRRSWPTRNRIAPRVCPSG